MTELNIERLQGQSFGNGRYTLLEPAASKTNMSIVYKAQDNNTRQVVAIKLLLPEHANNGPIRQRFELEATVSYGLQHPNIATTIDYRPVEENGIPAYLVMKWLPGESLESRIKSGRYQRMPPEELLKEAAALLEKIGSALDFIHQNKIVHRDIKPSNILIYNEEPYIVDFGIAKRIIEEGTTMVDGGGLTHGANTAPGTPRYIAPETVLFMPVDGRTDQYSMALVIYEMLTGTGASPYTRSSGVTGWQEMHLRQDPVPLTKVRPELPAAVWDVLQRALIKKPELRYPTMKEFSDAFRHATGANKSSSRHKILAISAVAIATVLGAGIWIGSNVASPPIPIVTPSAVVLNNTETPSPIEGGGMIIRTHTPTHTPTLSNDDIVATALESTQIAGAEITKAFETQIAVRIAAETAAAQTLAAQATATFTASPTVTSSATPTPTHTATATNTATATATTTPSPTATIVGGGQGTLLFTKQNQEKMGDIFQIDMLTRQTRRITTHPANDIEAVWAPDLTQIAFVSNRMHNTNNIYIIGSDGGNSRPITDFRKGQGAFRPSWSVDGKTIFFHYIDEDGFSNLYSVDIQTESITQITDLEAQARRPVMSSDGQHLIFFSNHEGTNQIYRMTIKDQALLNLNSDLQNNARPQISPDGSLIAFYRSINGGSGDIYVMDINGSQLRKLTDGVGEEDVPIWSPDGQKILFNSRSDMGLFRVHMISESGFGVETILQEDTFTEVTDWR